MTSGLPQFVVIGAVKAATTWIHNQLRDNPAVYLPGPEPHYFSQLHDRGLDYYRGLFAAARPGQILGEKSADYFAHPLAAQRLAAAIPDARLVLQLRNPVDRAYSDYKMLYRRGTVRKGPEDYLARPGGEQPRFLEDGLYAKHLRRWLDHFDPSQIMVLLFADVKADPAGTVARVSRHVGVPYHYSASVGARPRNDSRAQFLPLPVRKLLAPLKSAVRPLRGAPLFEGVRGRFAQEIRYPPLPVALRRRMIDFYDADVADLETLLGRDLRRWRAPSSASAEGHAEPPRSSSPSLVLVGE